MQSKSKSAKHYFDQVPKEWDTLYSHENRFLFFLNKLLRSGLYERYKLTFENCGEIKGARVLDIGCGTGRYSMEFAKRGASNVVGIDFAPAMVEFSQQKAKEMGVADKCNFVCGDFMSFNFKDSFDIIIALGFFDYIEEPKALFDKIGTVAKGRFLASFPQDSLIMGTQRKIRYHLKKCPLYFYTYEWLDNLYKHAKFKQHIIIPIKSINKGYFGIGINS